MHTASVLQGVDCVFRKIDPNFITLVLEMTNLESLKLNVCLSQEIDIRDHSSKLVFRVFGASFVRIPF